MHLCGSHAAVCNSVCLRGDGFAHREMLIVNQGSAAVVGGPRLTFLCNVYAFRTVIFSSHALRRAMMNLIDFAAFPVKETPRPVQSMAAASVAACVNTALGSSRNARHFVTRSLRLQIGVAPPGCPEHGVSSKHFSSCRKKSIDSSQRRASRHSRRPMPPPGHLSAAPQ